MSEYERDRPIGYQQPAESEAVSKRESAAPSHPRASQRRFIDLLREAAQVHAKLSEFYGRLIKRAQRPKARLLLEFMQEHERTIQACIREFENNSNSEALQAWFKYTPEIDPDTWTSGLEFKSDMTEDDIAALIARMDDQLMSAFEEIANRTVPENVREAVENFLDLEQRAKVRALRATEED
jgi:hypothetical protein